MDRTIGTHAPGSEADAAAPGSTTPPKAAGSAFGHYRTSERERAGWCVERRLQVAERMAASDAGRQVRSRIGRGLFKGRGRARSMQMRQHI